MPKNNKKKKNNIALPQTPEIKKLQAEIRRREAVEQGKQEIKQIGMKRAELKKKVKQIRFQQSGLGRTITRGKKIFSNIGVVAGKLGESFEKTTRGIKPESLPKPQQQVPQQMRMGSPIASAMLGAEPQIPRPSMPRPSKKKVKKMKPFNMNEFIAGLPQ